MMDILFFETGLNRLGWAGCWGRCPRGEKLCWGGDGRCWVLRGEWGSKGMLGCWKSLLGRDGGGFVSLVCTWMGVFSEKED